MVHESWLILASNVVDLTSVVKEIMKEENKIVGGMRSLLKIFQVFRSQKCKVGGNLFLNVELIVWIVYETF